MNPRDLIAVKIIMKRIKASFAVDSMISVLDYEVEGWSIFVDSQVLYFSKPFQTFLKVLRIKYKETKFFVICCDPHHIDRIAHGKIKVRDFQ